MSRQQRRRRERSSPEGPPPLIGRTELIAVGFLLAGIVAVVGIVLLLGGDDDGSEAVQGSPTVTVSQPPFTGPPEAVEAIETLARQSIELLPAGEWPSLYDDFVSEFRSRCTLEQFTQAGEEGAAAQGTDLPLLGYVRMQELTTAGTLVRGVVVGEVAGKSEYRIEAYFQEEDGAWKIAPAPDTTGCSAFNRL